MKKLLLSTAISACCLTSLFAQPCLPAGITFSTQAQIDSFPINYPNCTEIEGDVTIGVYSGSDITNLDGLYVVTVFGGGLEIFNNDSLTNLSGLDNLTTIGGNLDINFNINLVNLSGLDNLASIGGTLSIGGYDNISMPPGLLCNGNPILAEITALSNLTNIGGDLDVFCNNTLANLSGLENLTTIGGSLRVGFATQDASAGNSSLTEITGLATVSSIGGDLEIQGNESLTSLSGLQNIDVFSIGNMTIKFNNSLSTCEVQSICDYLSIPGGDLEINNNKSGCNSQQEVEEACAQSVGEVSIINNFSINPNPFSNTVAIEFELKQPEIITINICNHLGEKLEVITERKSVGLQKIEWNAEGLPAGIYFCVLKTNMGLKTMKMIKL